MDGEFMGENLNVPIYLDKELVLDLLASLDDGFACAETIRTDDNNVDVSSKKGGVGFNTGLLLGLDLNLGVSKGNSQSKSSGKTSEFRKYHTYGSMMNKLLDQLYEKDLIKTIDNDNWNGLSLHDFVQIEGEFIPDPFYDSFRKLFDLMDLASNISSLDSINNNQCIVEEHDEEFLKSLKEMIKSIMDVLVKENSQKYWIEINSEYTCIVNLFNEFIRDNSGLELPHGNFKILGKVIKKIENGNKINLLEETPLVINNEVSNSFLEAFDELNKGFSLPKIVTSINGKCIQIIPIAIFV